MTSTVLVTGSSRGIGEGIALALADAGYDVVVHCHRQIELANSVGAQIVSRGRRSRVLQFDVADREATRGALEADIQAHGMYYGIVCNAGIVKDAAFPGMLDAEWDQVLATNLDGFYNVLRPLIMPMIQARQAGRIVTLASMSGLVGNRGQVNYSAAKGGVIAASKALAIELAKRKITVNCVVPGIIETDMLAGAALSLEEFKKLIPMQRLGRVEEVAALVVFLLSEQAGYITRQTISVNGGML